MLSIYITGNYTFSEIKIIENNAIFFILSRIYAQ